MPEQGIREQSYEAMLEEARGKPGVMETLELWEATKKHLSTDDTDYVEDTISDYKRGVNDLFVQPR